MTINEIIWDVRILLRQISDDSDIQDAHILAKLNMYRALFMKAEFQAYGRIDGSWFQRLPLMNVSSVFSSDDPEIEFTTVKFGKVTLPKFIELGLMSSLRMNTAARMEELYYLEFSMLKEMIKANDYRFDQFIYYTIGADNQIYIYPYVDRISVELILENPLDGYVFNTGYVDLDKLTNGSSYTVVTGNILQTNNLTEPPTETVYKKGEEFTANNNYTYSGVGIVSLTDQVNNAGLETSYPVSSDMLERIIIEMLLKDFQLKHQQIADVINDSMDQIKLAFSEIEKRY